MAADSLFHSSEVLVGDLSDTDAQDQMEEGTADILEGVRVRLSDPNFSSCFNVNLLCSTSLQREDLCGTSKRTESVDDIASIWHLAILTIRVQIVLAFQKNTELVTRRSEIPSS